jgi:replication-associated recombination protein RarA
MSDTSAWWVDSQYEFDQVQSAFQKSIRRGLEEDALFWGTELHLHGGVNQAWNRMQIIASEDVGLASPSAPILIRTLHDAWRDLTAKDKNRHGRLYFIHAILFLVRAPKSRIADNATIVMFNEARPFREIPDWALDKHTRIGTDMGRGYAHFFDEGAKLVNQKFDDPYEERARIVLTKHERIRPQLTKAEVMEQVETARAAVLAEIKAGR